MVDIHSEKEFDRFVGEEPGWVLVDFYANWCRPCKIMATVLERLEPEMEGKIKFCRLDTEELEDLTEPFQLVGVPTFIVFKGGEEKGRIVGYHDRPSFKEKLENILAAAR